MPAVRNSSPKRKLRAAAASSSMRLALMQSKTTSARAKEFGPAAAGSILLLGAIVAGAAWIGGSLFELRDAMSRGVDVAAAQSGLRLRSVQIEGVSGARSEEIRQVVLPQGRSSLLAANPTVVKARVEALDWVRSVEVTRLWPSTLRVRVTRREAFALVQREGVASVVDADGRPAPDATIEDYQRLPLLVGVGALGSAREILEALDNAPAVRERAHALIRVAGRRWDVELRSGLRIMLPEREFERALARVEGLHQLHALLDRPLERVDMRHAAELVVLPGQQPQAASRKVAETTARLFAQGA